MERDLGVSTSYGPEEAVDDPKIQKYLRAQKIREERAQLKVARNT